MNVSFTKQIVALAIVSAAMTMPGLPVATAQSIAVGLSPIPPIPALPTVDQVLTQVRGLLPPQLLNAVGSAGPLAAPGASLMATVGGHGDMAAGLRGAVGAEVNAWRIINRLGVLAPNPELEKEAQLWAENLAARDVVEHNHVLLRRGGGENIVAAATSCNASCLVTLWKNSPGHNESMLDRGFRSAGVGVAYSRSGRVVVVQDFAY